MSTNLAKGYARKYKIFRITLCSGNLHEPRLLTAFAQNMATFAKKLFHKIPFVQIALEFLFVTTV
jgi:hypothetical protein